MLSLVREEDAVMDLVREVYYLRASRRLVMDPLPLARRVAKAVAARVDAVEGYDPEDDVQVAWLREVCRSIRQSKWKYPRVSGELEAGVQFLLGELPPADPRFSENSTN